MPPIKILVALADPTRCRLIEILQDGPQPVHVLAAAFKISRPAISRHLRVLKQAGLISEKKFGRENRYALHAHRLAPVQRWLAQVMPVSKTAPETADVATPQVAEPILVQAPEPAMAAKPARSKPAARPKPDTPVAKPVPAPKPAEPAPLSQMGFDF